jgi:hypothetical protein
MGKKAKFKQIRRIASQMPVIEANQSVTVEHIKGSALIAAGIKEVGGKPVDAKMSYRKKTPVASPINHHRNMKKLYNQMGKSGVGMYINAVKAHAAKQAQLNAAENTKMNEGK